MELLIDRVSKQYKNRIAVDRVSLRLTEGVHGLLGENGAGKTTLMRMLCGILTPTGGTISFDGADVGEEAYRARLGYLPQDFGYYPDFTAEDYLLYVAALKALKPMVARRRVKELLHKVGLEAVRKKKVKTFSGGMKRRLGVAQAVLNDPAILILDEPTAGLDPNERIRFRNLISELAQDRLVLLSTHIVSDVEYIAGEIFLMKDGTIAHSGATNDLISAISDRVWLCTVPRREVDTFARIYKVANVRLDGTGAQLRILAPQPPTPDAVPAEATLEDVFLSYFGETGGEMHDAV